MSVSICLTALQHTLALHCRKIAVLGIILLVHNTGIIEFTFTAVSIIDTAVTIPCLVVIKFCTLDGLKGQWNTKNWNG